MEFSERTGTWQWRGDAHRDGSLNHARLVNWHTSKYSFGLILDGLFAQSNFGIVTRMGVWLLPRPPAVQSFHFVFPDDDDLEEIIELARPMKMSNFVPSLFRVANDLYLAAQPVDGDDANYKSIVVVFTDLQAAQSQGFL
jgi:4-cresol dehydrogenase (hydroxylating)